MPEKVQCFLLDITKQICVDDEILGSGERV